MTENTLPKIPEDEYTCISNKGLEYIINNFDPQVPDRNFLWTTDYRVELPVRVKKTGPGSEKPYTLIGLWNDILPKFKNLNALTWQDAPNHWASLTYQQYYDESIRFAKALITLGIPEYTSINIIGFNSPEWAVAFHGSIFGHYLPIGQYTTNGPDACAYIANHSEATVAVMENVEHFQKYVKVLDKVKGIRYYIIWKGALPSNIPSELHGRVLLWKDFMSIGDKGYNPKREQDTLEYRAMVQKPGNCATFIYTSGTTGPPKAVMISHDNYTYICDVAARSTGIWTPQKEGTARVLSMLPLSHVAAQLVDLVITIRGGANVFFTDPTALQGNLVKFMLACRPTTFLCVPRVWQKIEERITAIGAETTGLRRKIADWAKAKAVQGTTAEINGGSTPPMWGLAKKLVFNKIKQNLGLDQCDTFLFSAAPMKVSTRLFFLNLNIYLHNIFGMSELAGPQTFSDPTKFKDLSSTEALKEAGVVLPGLQISIDKPDAEGNGQICCRGRNNFMGYFKDEKNTRATIDSRGFIHSGDIGQLDKNKVLSITGRIKELLITAGGENVAPVLIQNEINTALPILAHTVVIGDDKKYLSCLMTMRTVAPGKLSDEVLTYIKARGSNAKTVKQAIQCQTLRKIIQQGIDAANEKAISKAQRVQKFIILDADFSVDGGELTPTLKMKRKIINQKYEKEINSLYLPDAKL